MDRAKECRPSCANSKDGRRNRLFDRAPSVTYILRTSPASGQASGPAYGDGFHVSAGRTAPRVPKWVVATFAHHA
jgi:hypothetical protein